MRMQFTCMGKNNVQMKLHEPLVVFVDPTRRRSWFKEKGSRNGNSVCFQPFVEERAPSGGLRKWFKKRHLAITNGNKFARIQLAAS